MAIVYQHRRLDTNTVFYVGIGSIKRAFSKYSRSIHWHNIVKKVNYSVEIVFDNMSWSEACEKEKELIEYYRTNGSTLVNIANGGDGGDTISNHPNEDAIRTKKSQSMKRYYSTKTDQELKEIYGRDPLKLKEEKQKLYESELARKKCGRAGEDHWAFGSKQDESVIQKRVETTKRNGGYYARNKGAFAPKAVQITQSKDDLTKDFPSIKDCLNYLCTADPDGGWTRGIVQSLLIQNKKGIFKYRNGYYLKYRE